MPLGLADGPLWGPLTVRLGSCGLAMTWFASGGNDVLAGSVRQCGRELSPAPVKKVVFTPGFGQVRAVSGTTAVRQGKRLLRCSRLSL
ncbi:hypothetical protein Adi01nite_39480 [Amorphoplanes digitatis]|nr:hypothetical protein Adi01nite_39480 [Actinoplanes digitatis]